MKIFENSSVVVGMIVVAVLVGAGAILFSRTQSPTRSSISELENTEEIQESAIPMPTTDEVVQQVESGEPRTTAQQVAFVDEASTFALADSGPTVIFFKASWCPTCQQAQRDIDANFSELPADLVVVTADYDTEDALKTRYGITYQHTWVQVDSQGNELAKWNGGGVAELNQNIVR